MRPRRAPMYILLPEVVLRKLEPFDASNLCLLRNDPSVVNLLGGFSTGYALQDITDWIEHRRTTSADLVWAVADRDSNKCIGHVGLYRLDYRAGTCEFGILISPERWGEGIGKSVTAAVLAYGFDELRMNRIELTVLASNARAIALYESMRFVREGIKRQAQYRAGQ